MTDVRHLFEAAKSDPPPQDGTVDDIVHAGRRRLRRSRSGKIAGAALGLTVAAVAAVLVVPSEPPPTAAPGPAAAGVAQAPFSVTFAGYQIGDFQVTDPVRVTAGYQSAIVRRHGVDLGGGSTTTLDAGLLTVYAPAVFRPDRFTGGTPTTVRGRPGFSTLLDHEFIFGEPGTRRTTSTRVEKLPAIAWQYADDAWATLESVDLGARGVPAETVRLLADAFTATPPRPATTAFRAGHLPPGWELAAVGPSLTTGNTEISAAVWVADGLPRSLTIRVAPVEREGPYAHPVSPPCPPDQHICDVRIDDRYYAQVDDASGTLPPAELRAIADSLEFARIDQPATWFPATN